MQIGDKLKVPYLCDGHTHTYHSFDGENSPGAMCRAYIEKGFDEFAVTDHYDVDGMMDGIYPDYAQKADEARAEILETADKYSGKIKLTYGIELGQPHLRPDVARAFLEKYDFEYVIGSLHNLRDVPDFYYMKFDLMTKRHIELIFERNLRELSDLVAFDGISTVAHITYIHRYMMHDGVDFDFRPYHGDFRELFGKIISKGLALELNTSELLKTGIMMPNAELLKLYRDCGGELITVGTDSHRADDAGQNIADGYELLRSIGFRYVTTFREKKPIQHKL